MTYATQQDLVDRFGEVELIQLTDRAAPPSGAIDATVVAKALGDADQVIDGYLAGADLALPLIDVPEIVKRWAADIARYFLHKDAPSETVRANYADAIRRLQDVAAGRIKLQVDGTAAAGADETVLIEGADRALSRASLKDL